jgi:hypothetical protein
MRSNEERPVIEDLTDLATFYTSYKVLLVAIHEAMNGHQHPYVPNTKFLSATCYGNPTSDVFSASIKNRGKHTANITFTLGDGKNVFHLHAAVTVAVLIEGSETEWLLGLEGTIDRVGNTDNTQQAKAACYYDTARTTGFILMPSSTRKRLKAL